MRLAQATANSEVLWKTTTSCKVKWLMRVVNLHMQRLLALSRVMVACPLGARTGAGQQNPLKLGEEYNVYVN